SDSSSSRNSPMALARHRDEGGLLAGRRRRTATGEPGLAATLGQSAHPGDISLALGHRDDAARIQQVEDVARLPAVIIGGQRQSGLALEELGAGRLRVAEMAE